MQHTVKLEISFSHEVTVIADTLQEAQEKAIAIGTEMVPVNSFNVEVRPKTPLKTFRSISDMVRYCDHKGMIPVSTNIKADGSVSVILTKK